MGLFSRKKEVSAEELAARDENAKLLESFSTTKAWGIKKYGPAMQFIYDQNARNFVVVEGPEETFKERDPWVVSFDQVEAVILEVKENWQEDNNEYNSAGCGNITIDRYKDVWWRYDFYLKIKTSHPYAKTIRYKMNFKSNFVIVPSRGLFAKRGLEMNGDYSGEKLKELIAKLEEFIAGEPEVFKNRKTWEMITRTDPKGVKAKLIRDLTFDQYMKTLDNILSHVKRADRVTELLLG